MIQLEPDRFQFTSADRAMNTKVDIACGLLTIIVLAGSVATASGAVILRKKSSAGRRHQGDRSVSRVELMLVSLCGIDEGRQTPSRSACGDRAEQCGRGDRRRVDPRYSGLAEGVDRRSLARFSS